VATIDPDALAALRAQPLPRPPVLPPGPRRPRLVWVATAIVIGWGSLECASAALALLVLGNGPGAQESRTFARPLGWVLSNLAAFATVQLVCGAITALCGVAALARRPWARPASQVCMVTWGLLILAWAITLAVVGPLPDFRNSFLDAFSRGAMLTAGLSWAAPVFVSVWLLGQREVKEWFSAPTHAG
jgi:hypothetical protein